MLNKAGFLHPIVMLKPTHLSARRTDRGQDALPISSVWKGPLRDEDASRTSTQESGRR
jgi:type IV secretory pathway VirD2 relaxase